MLALQRTSTREAGLDGAQRDSALAGSLSLQQLASLSKGAAVKRSVPFSAESLRLTATNQISSLAPVDEC